MTYTNHPGDAEAAAAVIGMTQTYGYSPAVGDRVRCERPFRGDFAEGVVHATNGVYVLVEIDNEHLAYYPHELEYLGPGN